jgi:GPH family glycoside/pentoside/hexuronide:cation symporter
VFCTAVFALHWIFYTFAYIPLLGMAPEVARSREARVHLGTWIAAGMSVGLSMAAILPGVLIEALDPAQQGGAAGHSAVGYQRVAVIFALASLFCFQFFVWTVRERAVTRGEVAVTAPWNDMLGAFRNKLFLLYFAIFFLYYVGVLGVQRVVPQWAQLGLGGSEATVSVLGLPFVITCLAMALLCPLLNRVLDLKWILVIALACGAVASPLMYPISVMNASSNIKIILGAVLFGISGIGTGITYVLMTPLLGHIIDRHAEADGIKREALFNGLHNVMYKFALVGGIWVAAMSMNTLGNSVDRPLGVLVMGPIGGAFCLAALILGLFYPKSGRGPDALKG